MTGKQLGLLHVAYKAAGLNETQYRTVLRSAAGVESGRELSNQQFEDVMAVLEDCGFRDSKHPADHWRGIVARRGSMCGSRMIHKIKELAGQQRYGLDALCRKFSDGRCDEVTKLQPREAWKLIEMLKAVIEREPRGLFENSEVAGL